MMSISLCRHGKFWNLTWWLRQQGIRLQCRRSGFGDWVETIPWRKEWLPTPVYQTLKTSQVALDVKDPPTNVGDRGDAGSILVSGRSQEKGMATQSSILARIPMDWGAWHVTVHRVTKSRIWLKWLSTHRCTTENNTPISVAKKNTGLMIY